MPALQEDREILRSFYRNMVPQEGFDKEKYEYCAEYMGVNGTYIWQAKVLGWEVIRGDMPENPSMRDSSGNATMGDVVFMRMPKDRYEQLQRARKALVSEARGSQTADQVRQDIDDKISRLVGHDVNMSFKFRDQRDLDTRKKGD